MRRLRRFPSRQRFEEDQLRMQRMEKPQTREVCGHCQEQSREVIDYIRHEMFGDMDNADYEEIAREMNKRAAREDKIRGKRIEYLKKKLFEVQSQEANLVEAIKNGVEMLLLKEESARIKEKRESIQSELNYLENPDKQHFVTAQELKDKWDTIKNNLDSGDCYRLDETIHNLIERVDVFPDGYIRVTESTS